MLYKVLNEARKEVYKNEPNGKSKKKWMITKSIIKSETKRQKYLWMVGMLCQTVLGLRGCECWENEEKEYADEEYGLQLRDVVPAWNRNGKIEMNINYDGSCQELHHLRIELRNAKCQKSGQSVFLRMGRTRKHPDPAYLLWSLVRGLRTGWKGITKSRTENDYIFSMFNDELKLQKVKKQWMEYVVKTGILEAERYRFHGTRKGFATQLMRKNVPMSLIAFAGRWTLTAAIYAYLLHTQEDMIPLADIYLYAEDIMGQGEELDLDRKEIESFAEVLNSERKKKGEKSVFVNARSRNLLLQESSFRNSRGLFRP